jgi:3-oxoacyl-[acyl-carrier protein] reductase
MLRLQGKIALVTGCNKGIGLSVATEFLAEGCIVFAGVRNISTLSDALSGLTIQHIDRLHVIALDVTDADSCKQAIQRIRNAYGRLDVLVNNAGLVSYELVPFIDFEHFIKLFQTNVVGLMRMCQLSSRIMTRQQSGSIINISSIVSLKGASGQAAYAATKGAVNAFTLSLSKELAASQIRVNAVAPGMVATERLVSVAREKFNDKIQQIGLGRMADPGEIARICLFLASDDASYVTGQIIAADGNLNI